MQVHYLKTWPEYYRAVVSGAKKVEIRKDDRGFQVDDILRLEEYDIEKKEYTGACFTVKVTHILRDQPWVPEGYVAMSISPIYVDESTAFGVDCPGGKCEW
jgi:hypothetical protein